MERWNKEATLLLISLYEQSPALYRVTSPEYYNKGIRNEIFRNLSEEISKIRPNTTADDVKSKINTLRTQFLRERAKISTKKLSGSGNEGSSLNPSLWCYNDLIFLDKHTRVRSGTSSRKMSKGPLEDLDEDLPEEYLLTSPNDHQEGLRVSNPMSFHSVPKPTSTPSLSISTKVNHPSNTSTNQVSFLPLSISIPTQTNSSPSASSSVTSPPSSPLPLTSSFPILPQSTSPSYAVTSTPSTSRKRVAECNNTPVDEFLNFGEYVAAMIRGLKTKKLQRRLITGIQLEINRVYDEEDNED